MFFPDAFTTIERREGGTRHQCPRRTLRYHLGLVAHALLPTLVSILGRPQYRLAHDLSALYAHKINTLFWHDIDDPTEFGFARNQVTPFALASSDGEALYAWHVLPLDVYTRNEAALRSEERANAVSQDIASSLAFKLLQAPDARVVISCTLSLLSSLPVNY